MNIAIISDIEGISGNTWGNSYSLPPAGEEKYCAEMMTLEINAVVQGLKDGGVDQIHLYEAHTMAPGILPDDIIFHRRDIEKMGAVCQAVYFVGQHAMASCRQGVLAHTRSSATIHRLFLNGMPCGELTLEAATFGAMGVPTVFCSGDAHAGREAEQNLPPLEFVCDEIGLTNHSAFCRPFQALAKELREKARLALKRISTTPPFDVGAVEMRIEFQYHGMGEKIAGFSFAEWDGDFMVIRAKNMLEGGRLFNLQVDGRDFWCVLGRSQYQRKR